MAFELLRILRQWSFAPAASVVPAIGFVAWRPAAERLAQPGREAALRRLDQLAGVPPAHFKAMYREAVHRFAGFVQLLPASEAHHHAAVGRLLDHSLDVTIRALAIRRAHLLAPGADPEVLARRADRWTFAVFAAALFHDIAKPATDQEVECFDAVGRSLGRWNPWSGPMDGVAQYRTRFQDGRRYRDHGDAGPFVARRMLPDAAVGWLGEDREAILAMIAAIGGDHAATGILGEIVEQADGMSVSADLGAGSKPPRRGAMMAMRL